MPTFQQLHLAGGSSSRISCSAATGHTGAKEQPWANPPTPTLLPTALAFPAVSPSSAATCLFLGSRLLPSGCSSSAELLASILTASPCWLLTTSTKAMPHAGPEQSHRQTGAVALEGKCLWHGSSSSVAVRHGASPALAAGMAPRGWQHWNGSSAAAPGSGWALSLHRPGRDGTGPSRPARMMEAVAKAPACSSHVTTHIPPPPREHRVPALAWGPLGCNTLYSWSPSVSPGLETPAQPSSPVHCPQWGPVSWAQ